MHPALESIATAPPLSKPHYSALRVTRVDECEWLVCPMEEMEVYARTSGAVGINIHEARSDVVAMMIRCAVKTGARVYLYVNYPWRDKADDPRSFATFQNEIAGLETELLAALAYIRSTCDVLKVPTIVPAAVLVDHEQFRVQKYHAAGVACVQARCAAISWTISKFLPDAQQLWYKTGQHELDATVGLTATECLPKVVRSCCLYNLERIDAMWDTLAQTRRNPSVAQACIPWIAIAGGYVEGWRLRESDRQWVVDDDFKPARFASETIYQFGLALNVPGATRAFCNFIPAIVLYPGLGDYGTTAKPRYAETGPRAWAIYYHGARGLPLPAELRD